MSFIFYEIFIFSVKLRSYDVEDEYSSKYFIVISIMFKLRQVESKQKIASAKVAKIKQIIGVALD